MDTDTFVIHIKTEDFSEDIADDVEKWFETSRYDEHDKRQLPIGNNKKIIGLFKDELGGKIMKEFVAIRAKTYSYLMHDDTEHRKAKGTKKCVIERRLVFENYKDCLFNDKIILKSQKKKSKVIIIMYTLNKSVRLHYAVMMVRDYKHLIKLQHICMEQTHLKYAKVRC